jgi:putative DNA primase/helicase
VLKGNPEQWEPFLKDLLAFGTPASGLALFARTVLRLDTLLANIATFGKIVAMALGSQRRGQQYGPLLAGRYLLESTEVVSETRAGDFFASFDWRDHFELDAAGHEAVVSDSARLLRLILQANVRAWSKDAHATVETTLDDLIRVVVSGAAEV